MTSYTIVYNDGKPSDTFTNATGIQFVGGGTWVKVGGNRNGGAFVKLSIPASRIAEIQ